MKDDEEFKDKESQTFIRKDDPIFIPYDQASPASFVEEQSISGVKSKPNLILDVSDIDAQSKLKEERKNKELKSSMDDTVKFVSKLTKEPVSKIQKRLDSKKPEDRHQHIADLMMKGLMNSSINISIDD